MLETFTALPLSAEPERVATDVVSAATSAIGLDACPLSRPYVRRTSMTRYEVTTLPSPDEGEAAGSPSSVTVGVSVIWRTPEDVAALTAAALLWDGADRAQFAARNRFQPGDSDQFGSWGDFESWRAEAITPVIAAVRAQAHALDETGAHLYEVVLARWAVDTGRLFETYADALRTIVRTPLRAAVLATIDKAPALPLHDTRPQITALT